MNPSLLQSWLRLSPGSWPPDHYALLGVTPADAEPARIEMLVMERMEVLRRHQLRHPDLVTLGMNQLAQALVCLTDSDERAAYDAKHGFHALRTQAVELKQPTPAAVAPEPAPSPPISIYDLDEPDFDDTDEPGLREPTDVLEIPFSEGLEPPIRLDVESLPEENRPLPLPPPTVVQASVVVGHVAKATPKETAQSRRWIYRRLAVMRRCIHGWDELAPFLANSGEHLDRPAAVFSFLQAVVNLRPVVSDLRSTLGAPGMPGTAALAVIAQPVPAEIVRSLLPTQRERIAVDWRRGRTALETELAHLRGMRPSRRRLRASFIHTFFKEMVSRPVFLLIAMAVAAVVIGLLRSSARR